MTVTVGSTDREEEIAGARVINERIGLVMMMLMMLMNDCVLLMSEDFLWQRFSNGAELANVRRAFKDQRIEKEKP